LNNVWLGLDLTKAPTANPVWALIFPVLVLVTTWAQSKLTMPSTPPSDDGKPNQAQAMTQSMTTMMPLMFGFFSLSFSVGLSVYFVVSNLIGILQYSLMGQGKLDFRKLIGRGETEVKTTPAKPAAPANQSEKPAAASTNGAEAARPRTKTKTKNK
jgi:YidC/Oxa1 family membrane protein insertase